MVERVEITDDRTARAWLETQDHQTQVWFAARCALLGLPGVGPFESATTSGLAFSLLRCTLIAAAAATCSTTEMDKLTHAAEAAYRSSQALQPFNPNTPSVDSADDARDCAEGAARAAFVSKPTSAATEAASAAILSAGSAASAIDTATASTKRAIASAAISSDANNPLAWPELWPDKNMPEALQQGWSALKAQWAADDADWSFWIEWYEGILNGTPMDWDLIFNITTEISEEDWDAGPAAVAARIGQIRKDFESPPLDQDALQSQVQQLAQSPILYADVAQSAGLQVEAAILTFKREALANQLPDGFAAFETLAPSFLSISATLSVPAGTPPDTAALRAEINHLHSVIEQLRSDLREARSRLSDARLTALEARQLRTFGEKLQTTLTNIMMIGTIGVTTAQFFGVPPEKLRYEALKSALQGLSSEMEDAQPAPEAPTLPEATEV